MDLKQLKLKRSNLNLNKCLTLFSAKLETGLDELGKNYWHEYHIRQQVRIRLTIPFHLVFYVFN